MSGIILGAGDHDPTIPVGDMQLTEPEMVIAAKFSGDPSSYDINDVDYPRLAAGQEVILLTEESIYGAPQRFRIVIDNIVDGVTTVESTKDVVPPVRLIEATVLETDRDSVKVGEGVFGLMFPEGFAVLVDSAPGSDYTDRRIRAGLVLAEAGLL